ncbi:hypothetical protein [Actinacidiphila glaucinigra]|uniref:hypothetical protein n=1 Tax=Actinacidiphila glaucinigra TaxID=235986 RepID=UPI00366F582C
MDFNPHQFTQGAFRGFGDQAMRRYRVDPPAAQPAPEPPRSAAPTGHQGTLFQAAEVSGPPPQPTFNPSQFRISRGALPGYAASRFADQRVAPPARPAPAPEASPPAGPRWEQQEITFMGPTPASVHAPGAAGPSPTHWPTPTQGPAPTATPAPRTVTINGSAYRNAGPSRAAAPSPAAGPRSAAPPASSVPPRPTMAPANAAGSARVTRADRALPVAGLAVHAASRAFAGVMRRSTDPKLSGNPAFRTSDGWMRS